MNSDIINKIHEIFQIPDDVEISHKLLILLIKKVTNNSRRISPKRYSDVFLRFANRHSDAKYNYLHYLIINQKGELVNRTAYRTKKENESKIPKS